MGKLATEGLAPAGKEATTLVQNLTDLVGWIGKVDAIATQHNAEIARSTASYEDYAAEVVRVAVETGKLNEKQGQIVLATMLTADANTELSGTMQKVTEEIGLMTNEERIQLQQTESLTAAYEAAGVSAYVWSDAQATFTATSTYATEAMARQNDTITTQTGALYALQTAIKGVGSDLDFASQAASLLNDVLVIQGDTVSENNQRLLDFMLATGELTEAEYEDAVAKNKQINLLENLNGALAANMITMEQWTEVVKDGKITTEEMTAAVTKLWGTFLENSLDVAQEDFESMNDTIGDAYDKTKRADEAMINFAKTALDSGQPLSALAGSLGGLKEPLETGASKAKELDDTLTNIDGRTVNAQVIVDFIARTSGGGGEGVGDDPIYTQRADTGAGTDKAPPIAQPTGLDDGDLLGRMLAARDAMYGAGDASKTPFAPGANRGKGQVPLAPGMGDGKGGGVGMGMPGGFGQMANLGGVPVMLTINYYNTPPSVIDDLQMVAQMAQTGA